MRDHTVIGIDIAKNYIQIHGANNNGKVVLKKRVARNNFLTTMVNMPRCLIGMEACGGAHYWAKELVKLGFEVKLMSPNSVKRHAEHNKNDANDAKACSIAVTREDMKFVPIKTETQLEIQALHRVRSYYVKSRTALMNMTRGLLLELGVAIPQGQANLRKAVAQLLTPDDRRLSPASQGLLEGLYENLRTLTTEINDYTNQLERFSREDEYCQRIQTLSGLGPISSTAVIAKIGNGSEFKRGRELSAFLGLVPKQHSSGDKQILLGISKHGDRYVRQLLIHGGRSAAKAAMRIDKKTGKYCMQDAHSEWIRKLVARVGKNKASVAIANKNARMIVALLKNETTFKPELAH